MFSNALMRVISPGQETPTRFEQSDWLILRILLNRDVIIVLAHKVIWFYSTIQSVKQLYGGNEFRLVKFKLNAFVWTWKDEDKATWIRFELWCGRENLPCIAVDSSSCLLSELYGQRYENVPHCQLQCTFCIRPTYICWLIWYIWYIWNYGFPSWRAF